MEQKINIEKPKVKVKTPPTKRKPRAANLSKEQIALALQKKRECNARAQSIVEEFLDPVPSEKVDDFLSSLIHINQGHYDDIVEERSIVKLCGYPLCDISLTDVPKQQFVISRTKNKVYDITERKKFCSNKCYKSSAYLKEQILSTPLWVRKEDDVIPEFKLLSLGDETKEKTENGPNIDNHSNEKNEKENEPKLEKDEPKPTDTNGSCQPNSD